MQQINNCFANNLECFKENTALITAQGDVITYQSLVIMVDAFSVRLPLDGKQLLCLAANNSLQSIVAYLAALRCSIPVILTPHDKPETLSNIDSTFQPTILYEPEKDISAIKLYSDRVVNKSRFSNNLAVLLSTSGTTGSAKLVKLSAANINANAASIAEYLQLSTSECAITSLPMYYSYGLSVINSHLSTGASLVITNDSVIDESFWRLFSAHECTSFAGVPYSYELLKRADFEGRYLPSLRYMTQAGGKLPKELVSYYALLSRSRGWRFYVMYGQTEATARMSYLPLDKLTSNSESIGIAIPQGRFELIDVKGQLITEANISGELIYKGPNVMMGYAITQADLFDSTQLTELKTGDIAKWDTQSLLYISGRKSRFIKIFGNRIGLDDLETSLRSGGYVTMCGGIDQHLVVLTIDKGCAKTIANLLASKFKLNELCTSVKEVPTFPLLPSGKTDYQFLVSLTNTKLIESSSNQLASANQFLTDIDKSQTGFKAWLKNKLQRRPGVKQDNSLSVLEIFSKVFISKTVTPHSSFNSIGGDSLNYIQVLILLEKKFGELPEDWQTRSINELGQINAYTSRHFQTVETNIVLRALAIIEVLANHSHAIPAFFNTGGAALLFVLAGHSFARFQLDTVLIGKVWGTIGAYLKKIILPYIVICGAFILIQKFYLKKTPDYDILLMAANFYAPQYKTVTYLWFLQVLAQSILIIGILFSVSSLRRIAKNHLWFTSVLMLIIFSLICFTINTVWSTQYLHFRLPHIYIPLFLVGWCAFLARSTGQKIKALIFSFLLFSLMFERGMWSIASYIWLALGSVMLISIAKVKIFKIIKPMVVEIAAAAYILYLTHIFFLHFIWHTTANAQFRFILLLASCLAASKLFVMSKNIYQKNFSTTFKSVNTN